MHDINRFLAEFIRGADGMADIDSTSGKPHD